MKVVCFLALMSTIIAANWAVGQFGVVAVGFGLLAPAGVYFIGLSFTLRDLLQQVGGQRWGIAAILLGAGLSAFLEHTQRIALASATAFLVSESLNAVVFTYIKRRWWLTGVLLGDTAGLLIDSAVFLFVAFGSLQFFVGQVVAKAYMTAIAVAILWTWRHRALFLRHSSA